MCASERDGESSQKSHNMEMEGGDAAVSVLF